MNFRWTVDERLVTIKFISCHYENDIDMKNLESLPCLIARSLALVGDAWSMLIMRDAHAGLTRFDEFRKNLGIAGAPWSFLQ